MFKKKHCIVIGGGLAGLATAAQLAHNGYKVTLLEKNKKIGGRARVFKVKGFTFDMGPSWYMMPEVIESFFNSLDRKVSSYYNLKELKTKYRVFSDIHKPIDVVSSVKQNYKLFESLEPGSAKVLKKIIKNTGAAYSISLELLSKQYKTFFELLRLKILIKGFQLLLSLNPFQSYERFINSQIKHPLLQKLLQFHTVFLGGAPKDTPALYSILISSDFDGKIWYPEGGIGQLPRALEKVCNELGVKIVTNDSVTKMKINEQTEQITKVVTEKRSYRADLVVNTADYAYFDTQIIPKQYAEYTKEYWDSRDYSISSILIYLGISKKLPKLKHHNFYFQEDWNQHFETIKNTDKLPDKPCYYVCAPSVSDPSVAPKGTENIFILLPLSVKTTTNGINKYVDILINHIEETTKTNFKNNIIYKKVYAQKDFEKDYNAYKGNALGISHTLMQSIFLRPRMKSKKIHNLFFAGQFTQPGIGLPMVLLSAQYALDAIREEF
jgi:phytoene desaturase